MWIENWPLMLMALERIIRYPEGYDQKSYRSTCGTTRCVAGWVAYFAGWRDANGTGLDEVSVINVDTFEVTATETAAMRALGVATRNRSELGCLLFDGTLKFDDILTQVYCFAEQDGVTLTPLIITEMETRGLLPVKEDTTA